MDVIQSRPLPPLPASPPHEQRFSDMSLDSLSLPREPLFLDLVRLASTRSPEMPSSTEDMSTDMSTDFSALDIVYDVSTPPSHELMSV